MDEEQKTLQTKPARDDESTGTGSFFGRKSLVVGLTGGIATGKSTVAGMFRELGATTVSADEMVHELMRPGTEVFRRIVETFGPAVLSPEGKIDRRRLGAEVFENPERLACLESIVHPPVLAALRRRADEFRAGGRGVLVLEIPLLIETGSMDMVDRILLVTAEQETQVARLISRYHIERQDALNRIRAQMPLAKKHKFADWVISTEGTLGYTREQVIRVWSAIQKWLA